MNRVIRAHSIAFGVPLVFGVIAGLPSLGFALWASVFFPVACWIAPASDLDILEITACLFLGSGAIQSIHFAADVYFGVPLILSWYVFVTVMVAAAGVLFWRKEYQQSFLERKNE